jgi:hypothetical protein
MKPSHGSAKLTHGGKLLHITVPRKRRKNLVPLTQTYVVLDSRPDPKVCFPAFELTKENGEKYHVSVWPTGMRCDCRDGELREKRGGGYCKHIRSMIVVGLISKGATHGSEEA